jgi:two-component system chemotaxis response regulator CheY
MPTFIIDDREFDRDLAKRILATMQITRTCEFSDAAAALAEMPTLKPRLVLVDYAMAPMSGVEFATRVRSSGGDWSDTPILMVSGHAGAEHVRRAQESGVDGYVVKPYSLSRMRAWVTRALERRHRDGRFALAI